MLKFTGDTHGEQGRFSHMQEIGEEEWNENDTLLVSGDFGYVFKNDNIPDFTSGNFAFLNCLTKFISRD